MASVAYEVTGMTCEHCSRAVSAELKDLAGVTGVRVDLVPDGRSSVLVVSEVPLAVEAVAAAGLAWALLGEPVSVVQAFGGVLIIAGIYVARPRQG